MRINTTLFFFGLVILIGQKNCQLAGCTARIFHIYALFPEKLQFSESSWHGPILSGPSTSHNYLRWTRNFPQCNCVQLSRSIIRQTDDIMPPFTYKRKRAGGGYGLATTYTPRVAKRMRAGPVPSRPYMPRTPGALVLGETKVSDQFLAASSITASSDWTGTEHDPATTNCLFAPAPGTAINQRVGREVVIKKVKIRGFIQCASQTNQTSSDNAAQCRVMLVKDKQTNGTQMQGEQLMSTPTATAINTLLGFQSTANFGRFDVLKDKFIKLQDPNFSWDGTNMEQHGIVQWFKMNWRPRGGLKVRFNATGGSTVADIVDNSLHIVAQASNVALAPSLSYNCRVTYADK